MFECIIIFISKIIENTLSTLRIILIAKGKKRIGALLQGIISFIWIISTSIVVIKNNPYKILFFCLGASIGSYLGSLLEEKTKNI